MASGLYNCFKNDLLLGDVDLVDDTVKCGLYDNSHAFTATDTAYTTTNELATGSGYTRDGKDLAGKAVTGTTTQTWDATDTSWTSASFTAYHAVLYCETNSDSLICSIDFGGAQTVTSGTFTISWNASGIISLS